MTLLSIASVHPTGSHLITSCHLKCGQNICLSQAISSRDPLHPELGPPQEKQQLLCTIVLASPFLRWLVKINMDALGEFSECICEFVILVIKSSLCQLLIPNP